MSVSKFYGGQSVFITGASGFMGKALVEKLLRSCDDINKIYILLRPKRGQQVVERLDSMLKSPIFDLLRKNNPARLSKIVPIVGDVLELNLGIGEEDRKTLEQEVSIVIHAASSVRFDDPLKKSALINIRGTKCIMELAKNMKRLKAVAYISTAYSNCVSTTIEEKVNEMSYDWRHVLKLIENEDENILKIIEPKILDKWPNTYTFTKSLTENLVRDYSAELPCIIFRPSIVIQTYKEPVAGWLENLNGPQGLICGYLSGVLHVAYSNATCANDFMPCDMAINGIIVSTWYKGEVASNECLVVNCASGSKKRINFGEIISIGKENLALYPPNKMLWYPWVVLTENMFFFYVLTLLTHVGPAMVMDMILKLKKINFSLTRLYRKIFIANLALKYFSTNEWRIFTDNYYSMSKHMSSQDLDTFFYDVSNVDEKDVIIAAGKGLKKFIFNDDMSDSKMKSDKKMCIARYWTHRASQGLIFSLLVWFALKYFLISANIFAMYIKSL